MPLNFNLGDIELEFSRNANRLRVTALKDFSDRHARLR